MFAMFAICTQCSCGCHEPIVLLGHQDFNGTLDSIGTPRMRPMYIQSWIPVDGIVFQWNCRKTLTRGCM